MARRIHVPGIVDLLIVDDAHEALELVREPKLDRDFAKSTGPIVNRAITDRIRTGLRFKKGFLPALAARDDTARAERQVSLEKELNTASPGSDIDLAKLASYVNGAGNRDDIAVATQQIVGRLFNPEFEASAESLADAKVIDGIGEAGLVKWFFWLITGRVDRAKRRLAKLAQDDLHAVHGIAITVHNIVRSLDIMRERRGNSGQTARLDGDRIVDQCLVAPRRVMRRVTDGFESPVGGGRLRAGTLVLLSLDQARKQRPGGSIAFMTESWSKCPAHSWVPSLLLAVWNKAEETRA